MQKIKPLLDQTSKGLRKNSSASLTAAGQTEAQAERVEETGTDYEARSGLDHVDAINQVFAEFEFAYHNQFHKAFADAESLAIAKKYWLSCLENFSPVQIVQAAKAVIRKSEYLPSIAVILQACEQGYELFGLPSPREAYIEACTARSPKRDWQWSHEAVYFAGKAVGWFVLANEPESQAYPRFEYHYQQLCRKVIKGEKLHIDVPEALQEKTERPLGREEARARIAKLRKELDL
jgi:hypothetical protein